MSIRPCRKYKTNVKVGGAMTQKVYSLGFFTTISLCVRYRTECQWNFGYGILRF